MNNHSHERFREQLIGSERITPSLRERYDREVHMLLEKKLTAPGKWGILAMIGMQAVLAIFPGQSPEEAALQAAAS